MRSIVIGVAAFALAAPAAAHPEEPADPRDRELVRAIPQAAEVEAMGETMDRVVGAVLDMPIGPLVDAIEAADPSAPRDRRRYRRDETVGDVASGGDPYFEERLRDQIRGTSAAMGVMAEQLAVVAPEMRRAIERAGEDIDRAVREGRERRRQGERPDDRRR
jgi:hypothetical protein